MNVEIILGMVSFVAIITLFILLQLHRQNRRLKKALDQAYADSLVERNPFGANAVMIKDHSDQDYLAGVYARRIKELILCGASPVAIKRLLTDNGLNDLIVSPESDKDIFLQKVQKALYKELDDLDMREWMSTSSKNKQEHWDEMKGTILSNVRHNGFLMDLH